MNDWTPERIANLPTDEIKTFRKNAFNKGASLIVEMCDAELIRRASAAKKSRPQNKKSKHNDPVVGYHFVCRPHEKGVIRNGNGTVWSGTWVVAETQVERS